MSSQSTRLSTSSSAYNHADMDSLLEEKRAASAAYANNSQELHPHPFREALVGVLKGDLFIKHHPAFKTPEQVASIHSKSSTTPSSSRNNSVAKSVATRQPTPPRLNTIRPIMR